MSVVIETTLGDITVDLYLEQQPSACLNFLKLCKMKYYNYNLFHTITRGFIAQTGDPTGSSTGGESIYGILQGPTRRFFKAEREPKIKHTKPGLLSFVGGKDKMVGSQFFFTLGENLSYLDENHCVFGEVMEGFDVLEAINEVICDNNDRPYQDVRITHTVVLDDPFPNPDRFNAPSRSPSPSAERLAGGRIAPDEEIDETSGRTATEIAEMQAEREAKARATILEMVGDLPDADMAPPENVLFVCKLNPVTTDDDLEIIFSRFGEIRSCEVIRDKKSGDSLQYAFIEFKDQKACEDAYFKMSNVLIDDRRIHVDFSQSVSKVKWLGKGKGVAYLNKKGEKQGRDIGNGDFIDKQKKGDRRSKDEKTDSHSHDRRSRSEKWPSHRDTRKTSYSESSRRNRRDSPDRKRSFSPRNERTESRRKRRERSSDRGSREYRKEKKSSRSRNR
ncbi:peptidyl-prolyl cis-trans isomerase sig-7 [Anthonomus grandis grandis]|uniref:peptidyl-prolyl cis-trans isomerase sig-7 n=1 Tax=Anthonomus grandis grandis TaxID=2921223 RepID=UPI002166073D|nr:peptidyl-prolyl cis-trans isomerase sig-7 [Anthonomus grandis grandis]XP_050298241.1 peptidyl-prolyl cis-trans isomerase sig-7 [Anthonomus grandis grandis]